MDQNISNNWKTKVDIFFNKQKVGIWGRLGEHLHYTMRVFCPPPLGKRRGAKKGRKGESGKDLKKKKGKEREKECEK